MQVTLTKGQNLLEILRQQQVNIDAPCGGNGTCGKCMVEVQGFGKVRACKFRLPGTYTVRVPETMHYVAIDDRNDVLEQRMPYSVRDGWDEQPAIAVDLGTTTIYIHGVFRGRHSRVGFENPQRAYGADVMSRILSAMQGHGEALQQCVWHALEQGLRDVCSDLECDLEQARIAVAANTVMQHLLWNWNCEGLGHAPFAPVRLDWNYQSWHRLTVLNLPGISAFVGSDIASGILRLGMRQRSAPVLLIDLGTNGEMALGCQNRIMVASTAAGPAFEGSEPARQIHGSGVMRCIHFLLEHGYLDHTGMLAEHYFEKGYSVNAHGLYASDAVITQQDIRDIQMAKAAIRAGIELLLQRYGVAATDVAQIYLAGGMGYYIDPEDAFAIGLLPEAFRGKTLAVGNTAVSGALECLAGDATTRAHLEQLCSECEELQLADDPEFMERYVGYMNF